MGWARLDDGFHDHPKLIGLSLEALGLWTKCFTWAHRHHTSGMGVGFLPAGLPETFAGKRGQKLGNELVTHGLWDVTPEGWAIHDYVDYLPAADKPQTASEVSKARSEAGKRGAKARWGKATDSQADSKLPEVVDGKPMPPTRPDPTLSTSNEVERPRKRGTRLTTDWLPTTESVVIIGQDAPDVDAKQEHKVFVDYWIAQPGQKGVKTDWNATWRNWMRRKQADLTSRTHPAQPSAAQRAASVHDELMRRQAARDGNEIEGITA